MSTPTFIWCGNDTGIDLVNTAIVDGGESVDLLDGFDALWEWSAQAGVVSAGVVAACRSGSTRHRVAVLDWTRRLRSALRGVLDPSAADSRALDDLDAAVAEVAVRLTVRSNGSDAGPGLAAPTPLEELRLALAAAALRSLRLDRRRVKRCAAPTCVLLYHDTTRNGSRRWCDMAGCGNRAKASAFYQRTRDRGE